MALMDWFNSVWQNSGLAPLWDTVAPWLALDERQLIFMVATPFFIGVFLWEFLKIRHDATLVDSRESIRNFMLGAGYQTTELLFAGLIGGSLESLEAATLFRTVAMIIGSAGIFALIVAPQVKKLMGSTR